MVRNPVPWVAVAAAVALLTWTTWDQTPNHAAATVDAAAASFLVAATLLVAANLAALRDQRPGVPEMLASLPGGAEVRTRAALLATSGVAVVLPVLVIAGHLAAQLARGPAAGRIDPAEVLAAAAAAALLAVLGVALARWVPTLIAAPMVLFGFGTVVLCGGVIVPWHLPLAVPYAFQAYGRPTAPRLVFLVGGLVLLAAVALLRHGRRPVRIGIGAAALCVQLVAGVAVAVAAPPMWSRVLPGDQRGWEPALVCAEHNGVTYCHYPGFAAWTPLWGRAAEPIAAALPPGARMPVVVQQHREWLAGQRPGEVLVDTSWGRGAAELASRARLASRIAAEVTGLAQAARTAPGDDSGWRRCDGRGQARTVVALWLAGHAVPLERAPGVHLERIEYGDGELGHAGALLERTDAEPLIWRHWDVLLDPATTVDHARQLLGLPAGPPAGPPAGAVRGEPCA
jgi:hypothetical protein